MSFSGFSVFQLHVAIQFLFLTHIAIYHCAAINPHLTQAEQRAEFAVGQLLCLVGRQQSKVNMNENEMR